MKHLHKYALGLILSTAILLSGCNKPAQTQAVTTTAAATAATTTTAATTATTTKTTTTTTEAATPLAFDDYGYDEPFDTSFDDYGYDEPFDDETDGTYTAQLEKRPQGSVNLLDGRTVFITVVVSDNGAALSSNDQWYLRSYMQNAATYLEQLAADYGKESDIIVWDTDHSDLSYTVEMSGALEQAYIYSDYLGVYWERAESVMTKIPVADIEEKYDTDSVGFIFFLPDDGKSYAYPYRELYDNATYEFITLYRDATASTFAHEMLHTFGAMDLYSSGFGTAYKSAYDYIQSNYTDHPEIMNNVYSPDNATVIATTSDITLALLGLIDKAGVAAQFPEIPFPSEAGVAIA